MGIRLLFKKSLNSHARTTTEPNIKSGATRHFATRSTPHQQCVARKLPSLVAAVTQQLAQLAKVTDRLDKAIYGNGTPGLRALVEAPEEEETRGYNVG